MKLLRFLFGWILSSKRKDSSRNHPRNVKAGDVIVIEWSRIKNGIGAVKCINNDLETKKMLIEVRWNNHKDVPGTEPVERIILDYSSSQLKNFNLLNPLKEAETDEEEIEEHDIAKLQRELNKALDAQEYEKAQVLQGKIDKLVKK